MNAPKRTHQSSSRHFCATGCPVCHLKQRPPKTTVFGRARKVCCAGQNGLMHARLLLTQHFLAVAVDFMLRCSPRRGSGHSMIPTSVDFRTTLRRFLRELTEGEISGLAQGRLMLMQKNSHAQRHSFGNAANLTEAVVQAGRS